MDASAHLRAFGRLKEYTQLARRRFRKAERDFVNARREKRARAARLAAKALLIGVTGSSGKSTTTRILSAILKRKGRLATQVDDNAYPSLVRFLAKLPACDYGVVEIATSVAGNIRRMAELLQPDVAIVTLVALEHKSAFGSIEAVAEEKSALVAEVKSGGLVVLNADDPHVAAMATLNSAARVVTFGKSEAARYRVTGVRAAHPERLSLDLAWPGGTARLETRFVGEHFWMPVLAAVATALELGVAIDVIAEVLARLEPMPERCSVIAPEAGPHFVLDTVKAPFHSIGLAFDIVAKAKVARKRIVLGQMSDFSDSTRRYRDTYRQAREIADQVIFVGDHAHRSKASQEDRDSGRFREFATVEAASAYIRETALPGELILLKASRDLHLERLALSWQHPIRCWATHCGLMMGCLQCGLYGEPFERHRVLRRRRRAWYNRLFGRVPPVPSDL